MTTEQWFKAKRTTNAYAGYVKAGKKWLEDWVKVGEGLRTDVLDAVQSGDADQNVVEETAAAVESGDSNVGVGVRPAYAGALDVIGEHTPTVLLLLTTFKCEREGCKFNTAEGIRSAFKDYFEQCVNKSDPNEYSF